MLPNQPTSAARRRSATAGAAVASPRTWATSGPNATTTAASVAAPTPLSTSASAHARPRPRRTSAATGRSRTTAIMAATYSRASSAAERQRTNAHQRHRQDAARRGRCAAGHGKGRLRAAWIAGCLHHASTRPARMAKWTGMTMEPTRNLRIAVVLPTAAGACSAAPALFSLTNVSLDGRGARVAARRPPGAVMAGGGARWMEPSRTSRAGQRVGGCSPACTTDGTHRLVELGRQLVCVAGPAHAEVRHARDDPDRNRPVLNLPRSAPARLGGRDFSGAFGPARSVPTSN